YIPETYIFDEKQKIDMYKRFQSLESQEEMDDLEEELVDRFGDYPNEVDELFSVTSLKILAKRERVEQIKKSKTRIEYLVKTERNEQIHGTKLFELVNEFGRNVELNTTNEQLKITFKFSKKSREERYRLVYKCLEGLKDVNQETLK